MDRLRQEIIEDQTNSWAKEKGWQPVFSAPQNAKIVLIGQTPGLQAQTSHLQWNDKSGEKLLEWLGVTYDEFYTSNLFANVPMDFFYPGKGKNGDLPPRKDFAEKTLTDRVKNYHKYLPQYFPLPHPSPRNFMWMKRNDWFEKKLYPIYKRSFQKSNRCKSYLNLVFYIFFLLPKRWNMNKTIL